jgi:hypothetical protein
MPTVASGEEFSVTPPENVVQLKLKKERLNIP